MPFTDTSYGNGPAVRVARAVKNLSQARLAKLTGLTQNRVCLIEKDLVRPTPEEWAKIWGALTTL